MEKNNIFAIPKYYVDLFEMLPIIKEKPTAIESKSQSVFLFHSDTVGDMIHYYLQKTQFTALEGVKVMLRNYLIFSF